MAMKIDLSGKTALVTGSTRGIGLATYKALRKVGVYTIMHGSSEESTRNTLQILVEEDEGLTDDVHALTFDVRDSDAVADAFKKIMDTRGNIDFLVNSAGVTRDGMFVRMSDDDWNTVLATNLRGTKNCCQEALKIMFKQRSGVIVNVASVVGGVRGNAGQANYAASKAGVVALTKSLAKEYASRNIRINSVSPGFIDTDMTRAMKEKDREAVLANIPMGRIGRASEVADTVLYLIAGGSYITGHNLVIDGGLTA